MIFAAIIIGLLVGLVVLDETETEIRSTSRTPATAKPRPGTNLRPDRGR